MVRCARSQDVEGSQKADAEVPFRGNPIRQPCLSDLGMTERGLRLKGLIFTDGQGVRGNVAVFGRAAEQHHGSLGHAQGSRLQQMKRAIDVKAVHVGART